MDSSEVVELCKHFLDAEKFTESVENFSRLCKCLGVDTADHVGFFDRLKVELEPHGCVKKALWEKLNTRRNQPEYMSGNVGKDKKVLVIGAGPCGLRMAIEAALLGSKVIIIEMRDYISRNNVLHLWPFVIHDMTSIGAKEFYPKFATGNLNHVSIRKMQLMLLKVALILGVEIHAPVRFIDLIEPQGNQGWKVAVSPESSVINNYEFDSMIGANGARNCLRGFKRKNPFRAKLAIAITANFVNNNTMADVCVEEIPGIFCFMNPEFFGVLKSNGFDLENFVYYKDATHYFVMTVKKQSLLEKGVLKQDYGDPAELLKAENINRDTLSKFARDVAQITTANKIPNYEYAKTHRGEEDVAVFDFTVMYQSENAVMAREVEGKKLLTAIVGDSLINPFWPRGTGCAHGFLGVLDTAWMLRNWWEGERSEADILCERESIFSLLSQTNPGNLNKNFRKYTIDPKSRYGVQLVQNSRKPQNVSDLYRKGRSSSITPRRNTPVPKPSEGIPSKPQKRSRDDMSLAEVPGSSLDTHKLLNWYRQALAENKDVVEVTDLTDSWRDGMALCCLISKYRPEIMDASLLIKDNVIGNTSRAFELIEREFGVCPMLSPSELASTKPLDRLGMLSYLACLHEELLQENVPSAKTRKLQDKDQEPEYSSMEEYLSQTLPRDPKAMVKYMSSNQAVVKSMSLDRNMMKKKPREKKNKSLRKMYNAVRKIYMQKAFVPKGYKLPSSSVQAYERWDSTKSVPELIPEESSSSPRGGARTNPEVTAPRGPSPVPPRKPPRLSAAPISSAPTPQVPTTQKPTPQIPLYKKDGVPLPDIPAEHKPEPLKVPKPTISASPKPGVNRPTKTFKEDLEADLSDEDEFMKTEDEEEFWRRKTSSIKACRGMVQSRMGIFARDSPQDSPPFGGRDRSNTAPVNPSYSAAGDHLNIRRSSSPYRPPITGKLSPRNQSPGRASPSRNSPADSPSPASSPVVKRRQKKLETPEEKKEKEEKRLSVKEMLDKYQKREEKIKDDAEKSTPVTQMHRPDGCCICQQKLYFTDRHAAHGFLFHRHCYKCYQCETQLRLGSSVVKKLPGGEVQFYCIRHGYLSGAFEAEWEKDEGEDRLDILEELKKQNIDTKDYDNVVPLKKDTTDCKLWEPDPTSRDYEYFLSMQDQLRDSDSDDPEDHVYEEIEYAGGIEEEASDSDDEEEDEFVTADYETLSDYMQNVTDMMGSSTGMAYQSTASLRLFLGDTIQQGIGEVQDEEEELELLGVQVERSIRGERQSVVEEKPEEELMDDFLDVMHKKKELSDKESKLTLQMMLMELEERHIRLKAQLAIMEPTPDILEDVKALSEATSDLELKTEMAQVSKGLTDLKVYLKNSGETKA